MEVQLKMWELFQQSNSSFEENLEDDREKEKKKEEP
jgi:hypothetical protein